MSKWLKSQDAHSFPVSRYLRQNVEWMNLHFLPKSHSPLWMYCRQKCSREIPFNPPGGDGGGGGRTAGFNRAPIGRLPQGLHSRATGPPCAPAGALSAGAPLVSPLLSFPSFLSFLSFLFFLFFTLSLRSFFSFFSFLCFLLLRLLSPALSGSKSNTELGFARQRSMAGRNVLR